MNVMILVPIKEPDRAKSRLSPLLEPHERSLLAWAMLEDLICALEPLPCSIAMLTGSKHAAARAENMGWRILWEEEQISESISVDEASRSLAEENVEAVLRIPADLPLVRTQDVAALLSLRVTAPGTVLVPSADRRGTNAILRNPPDLFPSRFGPDSFSLHIREAAAAGAEIRIVENPHLALDLDDQADLARFLTDPVEGNTWRTLVDMQIAERLR